MRVAGQQKEEFNRATAKESKSLVFCDLIGRPFIKNETKRAI
jgi:hypothetical protein